MELLWNSWPVIMPFVLLTGQFADFEATLIPVS